MNDGAPAVAQPARGGDKKELGCRVFREGHPAPAPTDLNDLSKLLKEERTFVWFDVIDPGARDLALLEKQFSLHPLAIEDAVQAHQRPKIEEYNGYWFIVVQAATLAPAGLTLHEIAIFAGSRFVVTVRHDPAYPLEEIERRWLDHAAPLRHNSGFLVYTILDTIVDEYFPIAEAMNERIDDLEAILFQQRPFGNDVLKQIFSIKRDVQMFRHAALPLRDILNPIIRRDLPLFPEEEMAYFRDVYDHAVRVVDQLDAARDLVTSALEIHLSVVANRQNEIAKQLTIIATIFLPMSFITGFFGQNFDFLISHITGAPAFWFLGIGSQLAAVVALVIFFRRRGWL